METTYYFLLVLLPVLYTLLITAYARIFTAATGGVARIGRPLLIITLGTHFSTIGLRSIQLGTCPLMYRGDHLALIALAIVFMYLIIEVRSKTRSTGVFLLTPAFILQVLASVMILQKTLDAGSSTAVSDFELGTVSSLHALSNIIAYSALAIASAYGLLYLFLYRGIKRASYGLFFQRMPDLETLSRQNYHATILAFCALSLSLLLGYLPHESGSDSTLFWERLITGSAWVFYGAIVLSRVLGLGGKRLAYSTVLGLGLGGAMLGLGLIEGGIFG